MEVAWTEYLRYRAALRGFELEEVIEQIVTSSKERYVDVATNRSVAVVCS